MNQNTYNTFQNSVFPQINRAGSTTKFSKKRPITGEGRDAKIDQDLYYHVKEENEQLKKTKLALNQKITKLEASIANIKENIIKERKQADYRVVNMGKKYDLDFENTKLQNQKLKLENDKKDLIIQGLQSNVLLYKTKQSSKAKKNQKNKNPLTTQKVKNDYLALINKLREQLKIANEDRRNLISEMKDLKDAQSNNLNYPYNNTNYIQNKDREMANKMADLSSNYENANMKLETQNKILEMTKKTLEDYMEKYEKERENNKKLQAELSLFKGESDKIANLQKQLDYYKNNETRLEEELSELRVSPFIKQAEERGNVYRSYQISEKNLADTKKKLKEKERILNEAELKLEELEKENKELKDNLGKEKIEKDKYKDEALKLKITGIEREKNDKLFQDRLNQFNQYGEIDSNFTKILSLYKNQNDDLNWANINFIEPDIEKINDPIYLKNEIKRLRIEKNSLGKELENTKNLLLIQQQVNDDNKKLQDFELEKFKYENKILNQKIEDLCKLIDMKKAPQEYTTSLKETYKFTKPISVEPKTSKTNILDDNITEFSQEETEVELAVNENALDIYFGECVYEEGIEDEIGYEVLDNMQSFFSVDFYVHETQTSDILVGKNPMFNFQLIFKVDINESLLNYLENDFMEVEFYSIRDNVQMKFGDGKISLKELLEIENAYNTTSRVINSECPIFYNKNPNLKVATIYYKMRMRKPISEAIKWYHEQKQLYNEKEPIHEALLSKAEQSMKEYSDLGGKAYEIKILINKAIDLVVSGPARRIAPYFYYKFYKNGERYSQVSSGNNPQFEDTASFNAIYNKDFLDYIEKENLNIYLFDSMNPIELDVTSQDEARLVNSNKQLSQDLIGICRIPLQGLLVNDLIQGEFPIYNMKEQRVGKLIVNIYWEEIKIGSTEGVMNGVHYDTNIYHDNLIVKLANALKEKGLNIESAFNIFDIDNRKEISLDNFKNTLIFTLKFTTNQNEVEHLIKLLYTSQGKTKLDKVDFYKIFSKLLPSGDQTYKSQYNNINDTNNNDNNINNNTNTNRNIQQPQESTYRVEEEKKKDDDELNNSQSINPNYMSTNQFNNNNLNNLNNNTNNQMNEATSPKDINKNRTFKEIGELVIKYKLQKGKTQYDAVDLFKDIFDKDSSLGIDRSELFHGFQKMDIFLTDSEVSILWKKLVGGNKQIDFASFKRFHEEYCLVPKNNENSMRSLGGNLSGSQNKVPLVPQAHTEYHG